MERLRVSEGLMERLWAPWRSSYIQSEIREDECFLCIKGKDEESLVLGRKAHAFVIMNKFPYTNGHVMVAPLKHKGLIEELEKEEIIEIFDLIKIMARVFKEVLRVEGINIGLNLGRAAGAGLEDHIHFHMVPRWIGDTNFMPLLSETKVISEHILETYRKLKEGFEKLL